MQMETSIHLQQLEIVNFITQYNAIYKQTYK